MFKHLNLNHGLSQSTVKTILRDTQGFMWFGTEDGLNRWDGYNMKVYRHDPGDSSSISHNNISKIFEDRHGNMWISTLGGGLNRYDKNTDIFIRRRFDDPDALNLGFNYINDIIEDHAGNFWIGFDTGGLLCWNPETDSLEHFKYSDEAFPHCPFYNDIYAICEDFNHDIWIGHLDGLDVLHHDTGTFSHYRKNAYTPEIRTGFNGTEVNLIFIDSRKYLWVGTQGDGLGLYDRDKDRFKHFTHSSSDPASISDNNILSIHEDTEGILWIGTEYGGINKYNAETGTFTSFLHMWNDKTTISDNSIETILDDGHGTIWVGTYSAGISFFHKSGENFQLFQVSQAEFGLTSSNVISFCQDSEGRVWIGTDGGGLNLYNPESKTFTHFIHSDSDPSSLNCNSIFSLYEDKLGNLWVGTFSGGLNRLDRETGKAVHYTHDPLDPSSIIHNDVRDILEDSYGCLWIGTSGGLDCFNREEETFSHIPDIYSSGTGISHHEVFELFEDKNRTLWVGTYGGGLNRYDRVNDKFFTYQNIEHDSTSLSNNYILSILEDTNGRLWIGTGCGLNLYIRESDSYRTYYTNDGLPNDFICGIEQAVNGDLWISTYNGLCCFDPDSMTFRNYDIDDGLQSNDFNYCSHMKTSGGRILFGGKNGFNIIDPSAIRKNTLVPPVVLTDIAINNKPVVPGGPKPRLESCINQADVIHLYPKDLILTLSFAALNYERSYKNQYAYILEGFSTDWSFTGRQRTATYTNLDPREYVFRVRASNNDGVWNLKGREIHIIVHPPFYKTLWFRVLLFAAIISVIWGLYLMRTIPIKKKNIILRQINQKLNKEMRERKKAEKQLLKSLSEKDILLKEIHHRVKNNLQIISSLLSLQSRKVQNKKLNRIFIESQDRIRSMALVHEKLYQSDDFSGVNFAQYIESLANGLFAAYKMDREKVTLNIKSQPVSLCMDKAIPLGLVVNELISNSLKHAFTGKQENGLIDVCLTGENNCLSLRVRDNGRGLPPEIQIKKTTSLGLRLIYVLVEEQLDGTVTMENNNGTCFTIDCSMK